MLVIRRHAGESLRIGDDIEIEILEAGSTVKLGIRAPRAIAVLREEVYLTRQQNRAASAEASPVTIGLLLGALKTFGSGPMTADRRAVEDHQSF